MAGKKGRSGRRPLPVEMNKRHIIEKAWKITDKNLDSVLEKNGDLKKNGRYTQAAISTAEKMVVKDMPSNAEGTTILISVTQANVDAKRGRVNRAKEEGVLE